MQVATVVRNGKVVHPSGVVEGGWIGIDNEKIVAQGSGECPLESGRVIDAGGHYVIPGVIDPHVHMDWPVHSFEDGCRATSNAVASGITSVIHFMLEAGKLVDGIETHKAVFEKNAFIDGTFHAAIFTMDQVKEIPRAAEAGVTSFKFFVPYRGAEAVHGFQGIDDGILFLGMREIGRLSPRAIAMFHCENIEIFFKLKEEFLETGRGDKVHWHDTRPNYNEAESMYRIINFAKETDPTCYVVHMTIREGVNITKYAWEIGIRMHAETCPQYLTRTRFNVDRILGKVNPPLRAEEDNDRLWEGIREGVVTHIGSDHAPCRKEHKEEFWSATVGMPGVDTLLPVILSEGVNKGRISWPKLVEICSANTAKVFGLTSKGLLSTGFDADLVIVDANKEVTVTADMFQGLSDFTPYEGMTLKGWPTLTMVRGEVVFENGKVVGKPGTGKFLKRSC